jgi:cell wall-associated NlpC family hydrolase
MKKLILISAVAILLVGYSAVSSTADYNGNTIETIQKATKNQEVTKPIVVVDSPVKTEVIFAGPVKSTDILSGPVLRSDPPLFGSYDWVIQEKLAKDKLKRESELKLADTEAKAAEEKTALESRISQLENIVSNTKKLNETLELVKNRVGKTPWVFQGSSPRAWDCSGLVRWTYAQLGIDLYHSATAQRNFGTIVTEPKIGDLVSFNYRGSGKSYHIGIYLGPDEMIHSGGEGDRTNIMSITKWAEDNNRSEVVYTRIMETIDY